MNSALIMKTISQIKPKERMAQNTTAGLMQSRQIAVIEGNSITAPSQKMKMINNM